MYSNRVLSKDPRTHSTYRIIADRMKDCGIDINSHFDDKELNKNLEVYESTLDGISFRSRDRIDPLIPFDIKTALQNAKKDPGMPAFRQGKVEDAKHWALDLSMAATTGTGFREIWRPVLTDLGLQLSGANGLPGQDASSFDNTFSAHFGKTRDRLDISSLHCAVFLQQEANYDVICSIHIDETGFVVDELKGLSNDAVLTPDSLRHLIVELLWKDKLGIPEGIELVIPGSANDYARAGLRGTASITDRLSISIESSCSVRGKFGCSQTVSLKGTL